MSYENTKGARIYEYTSASNPLLKKVPIFYHLAYLYEEGESRIIPFDNREYMEMDYPATSPSLLCSFIKIKEREKINTQSKATRSKLVIRNGPALCRPVFTNGSKCHT